jgi:DNA-binding NarL/FixJ family response regulator
VLNDWNEIFMITQVLIVDDMANVRQDLHTLLDLRAEIEIVGEAANGQEAIQQVEALKPDVVLLDLEMPVLDGYAAAKQIKVKYPSTRIIALTVHSCQEAIQRAFQAGVDSFVVKGSPYDDLIQAILEDQG